MTASAPTPVSRWAETQHARGRLTAHERVALLLDPGSLAEVEASAATGPDIDAEEDGVITVRGCIGGRDVCVFAKDFRVAQGTLSDGHARKITRLQEQAVRGGMPIIGLYDTAGLRLEAGLAAWSGFADIARRSARAQGLVPQLSVVLGPCPGGDAMLAALSDFVIMANDDSACYMTGPDVVRAITKEQVDIAQLGGAALHAGASGLADGVCDNDVQALLKVRRLFEFLPLHRPKSGRGVLTPCPCLDKADRSAPALDTLVSAEPGSSYDVKELIREIADGGDFMELGPAWAANMVTGFMRLHGRTLGVVANQSRVLAGVIDDAAARKAARFIRFCDDYGLPVLSLVDAPGFLAGVAQEQAGLARHAGELLAAYARARVPLITLVLRQALGAAGILMGARALGADIVYAWPQAQIGLIGVRGAMLLGQSEAAAAQALASGAAVASGEVDEVIVPRHTRVSVIRGLEQLAGRDYLQEHHVL